MSSTLFVRVYAVHFFFTLQFREIDFANWMTLDGGLRIFNHRVVPVNPQSRDDERSKRRGSPSEALFRASPS